MVIKELLEFLNTIAPFDTAESYDNPGLLVGSEETEITGICCCLDITHDVINEALEKGANVILSHHPVIFGGLNSVPEWHPITGLIKNNIAAIAMHTNFDIAQNGVNETLVKLLDFERAGLDKISKMDNGYGIICNIGLSYTPQALAEHCKTILHLTSVKYGRGLKTINRIAVCCGGGVDREVMEQARKYKIDAIISGDIKHNFWIEAENCGLTLIDAGHYGTEKAAGDLMVDILIKKYSGLHMFSAESEKEPYEFC